MQAADHIQPPHDAVPQSLHRLGELARNLWWSWNQAARQLFESIDPTLWFLTHHNPVQLLAGVKPERFATLASDTNFTPRGATGADIKLVSVMSSIKGEEVETRWGLHPRFRQDLTQEETKQLTTTMNRVAKILGERYATVAFSDQWASWHKAGHA